MKDKNAIGENVGFDRIRRITGYLAEVNTMFNDAKKSEEKDRVKHDLPCAKK